MPVLSPPQPILLAAAGRLPVVLLGGACLHGCLVRIIEAVAGGAPGLTLGLSPFELITMAVALRLLWIAPVPAAAAGDTAGWAEAALLATLLVPSSTLAWVGVAAYATRHAWRETGSGRTGTLLILALALCALWSSAILKWVAGPATAIEAWLVARVLAPLRPDIGLAGNVIGDPAGHSLILLTRCTTVDGLPLALLATLAVAILLGGIDRRRLWSTAAALVAVYAAANLLRLAAMAWSGPAYEFVHGPLGANLYDAWQTALVLICGNRLARS